MKIKEIRCENFRRFKDFQISFQEDMTVLVAKNGAGKSSILDAISISLGAFFTRLPNVKGLSQKNSDFLVYKDGKRPPYSRISCSTTDGISWDRTERRDKAKNTSSQIPQARGLREINELADSYIDAINKSDEVTLPTIAYFGTGRGVFEVPQRKRGFRKEFRRFDAYDSALDSKANFKNFIEYFYALEDRELQLQKEKRSFDVEIPELSAIRRAIEIFMPEFSNLRAALPAGIMLDWKRGGTSYPLRIEQLSDGYRIALVMVMDIASRMAEANPHASNPLDGPGIVLIDEVELHLHPGWQQRILLDLRRTFPNIQFVVSTHSAHAISTVRVEQLRVIDWIDESPTIVKIPFSEGAAVDDVLDDILGVERRPPDVPIVKKLKEYSGLVESGKWNDQVAIELKREIDAWGKGYETEIDRLEMEVELQKLESKV
ncbi:AAA family ATPase [uncultured Cohaesibacter sp.]|uniref:AAA family ATPase n=1 Tax=uncultured Cohaesibacter sp. TaxID=1002546 RepID=UPI0029C99FCD|nr:AAA family ATPase [uncultured Cohaesibacter sp.]